MTFDSSTSISESLLFTFESNLEKFSCKSLNSLDLRPSSRLTSLLILYSSAEVVFSLFLRSWLLAFSLLR